MMKSAVVFVVLFITSAASAMPVTLSAFDKGWYHDRGVHSTDNENYVVGRVGGVEYRNFFAFDLAGGDAYEAATLRVYNQLRGCCRIDDFETITLFDVHTPGEVVVGETDFATGDAIYEDLGTGRVYGATTVSAADNNRMVEFRLNSYALDDINDSAGLFVIGGRVTTLGEQRGTEGAFAQSHHRAELVLIPAKSEPVPEPTSLVVMLGLVACCGATKLYRSQCGTNR